MLDRLDLTEQNTRGFRSTDLLPKYTIEVVQVQPVVCLLDVHWKGSRFFSEEGIVRH